MGSIFFQVSLLIVLATVLAVVFHALKLPSVLAYLGAGVLVGPLALNLISETGSLQALSTFGIAFLLFLVGIELDVKRLRSLGRNAPLIGLGQVVLTVGLGYLIVRAFGLTNLSAWYVSLSLAFSSTIIIIKLLSEKNELESLSGRLTLAMLLLQDAVAILAMVILSSVSITHQATLPAILMALARGALLVLSTFVVSHFLLPPLFARLARTSELLLLASLSWCLLVALNSQVLGFSVEIGAFLAGLSLASLPYNLEISARVRSLRDFFITLFFVALGTQLTFAGLGNYQPLFWALTAFVILGNPLIVLILMGSLGYRKRLSFMVGLTVGMISEFSLVLMGLGLTLGHVSPSEVALVTTVGAVTITFTSFTISHAEFLYQWLKPFLNLFERATSQAEFESLPPQLTGHVVLIGYHRLGEKLATTLVGLNKKVLIIDFNPDVVSGLSKAGKLCLYGDMTDVDILAHARVAQAEMVISTNSDVADNLFLLQNIRAQGLTIPVYVTAVTWRDCRELYQAGADYVIFPHYLSSEHFSLILRELALNHNRVLVDKQKHLQELEAHYAGRTSQ